MAKFQQHNPQDIVKMVLPSTKSNEGDDQAWVLMDLGPMETRDTLDIKSEMSPMEANIVLLTRRIKDWNYTDTDGQKLDVIFDNVLNLNVEDVRFLCTKIPLSSGPTVSTEEKKTLSDTSGTPLKIRVNDTTTPTAQSQ